MEPNTANVRNQDNRFNKFELAGCTLQYVCRECASVPFHAEGTRIVFSPARNATEGIPYRVRCTLVPEYSRVNRSSSGVPAPLQ